MSIYKITPDLINDLIVRSRIDIHTAFDKATVVSVQLENGFVITETSACVDPKNYDRELGVEICIERIKNRLWELTGFHLQQSLYENKKLHIWEDNI